MKITNIVCDLCDNAKIECDGEEYIEGREEFKEVFQNLNCKGLLDHSVEGNIIINKKKIEIELNMSSEEIKHMCKKCYNNLIETVLGEEFLNMINQKD